MVGAKSVARARRVAMVCTAAIALGVTVFAPRAWACKQELTGHVSVYPSADTRLATRGRIVLDVYQGFGLGFPDIEEHHPQLRSVSDSIALRSVEKNGSMLILAAEHPLHPGASYTLAFDPPLSDLPQATWETETSDDRTPPRWLSRPTATVVVAERGGCRPALAHFVDITVAVAEPVIIRAEVRDRRDARPSRALLLPQDNNIRLAVTDGSRYTVKLTAIDLAGNEAKASGPPIEIVVPSGPVAKPK